MSEIHKYDFLKKKKLFFLKLSFPTIPLFLPFSTCTFVRLSVFLRIKLANLLRDVTNHPFFPLSRIDFVVREYRKCIEIKKKKEKRICKYFLFPIFFYCKTCIEPAISNFVFSIVAIIYSMNLKG